VSLKAPLKNLKAFCIWMIFIAKLHQLFGTLIMQIDEHKIVTNVPSSHPNQLLKLNNDSARLSHQHKS
jgi:hypothetical protein